TRVRPTASPCLWTFTPRGWRLSRARWFRFSRSAGGSVEATKQKLFGNGLVFHGRQEYCPLVRDPLPPFCTNKQADGKITSSNPAAVSRGRGFSRAQP